MKKLIILTCFPFLLTITTAFAQEKYFAGYKIKFNEVTQAIYQTELNNLRKSDLLQRINYPRFIASLPLIEPMLSGAGIPDDFKFASIYPRYQINALNKINVESGVYWMLSPQRAQQYQLTINAYVDERKHIALATEAAIKQIQDFQKNNNHWVTSLFRLLAEPDWVRNLGISQKFRGEYVILDDPNYRPLIAFLAFKTYLEENFLAASSTERQTVYLYRSATGKSFYEVSEELQVNIHELINNNQWLLSGKVPASRYPVVLYVPLTEYYSLKKNDDKNLGSEGQFPLVKASPTLAKGLGGNFFTINGIPGIQAELGDKFVNLAYKAKLSPEKFLSYNDLNPKDNIIMGKIYYLKEKKKKAVVPYHIATPQETLWDISQNYGVQLKELLKYNRFDKITKLVPGQVIWLQTTRPKNTPIQYIPQPKESENIFTPVEAPLVVRSENPSKRKVIEEKPIVLKSERTIEEPVIVRNEEKEQIIRVEETPLKENVEETQPTEVKTQEPVFEQELTEEEDIFEEEPAKPTKPVPAPPKKKFLVHEVKTGETLLEISKKYKVDIRELKRLNNMANNYIMKGDKLIIRKL